MGSSVNDAPSIFGFLGGAGCVATFAQHLGVEKASNTIAGVANEEQQYLVLHMQLDSGDPMKRKALRGRLSIELASLNALASTTGLRHPNGALR